MRLHYCFAPLTALLAAQHARGFLCRRGRGAKRRLPFQAAARGVRAEPLRACGRARASRWRSARARLRAHFSPRCSSSRSRTEERGASRTAGAATMRPSHGGLMATAVISPGALLGGGGGGGRVSPKAGGGGRQGVAASRHLKPALYILLNVVRRGARTAAGAHLLPPRRATGREARRSGAPRAPGAAAGGAAVDTVPPPLPRRARVHDARPRCSCAAAVSHATVSRCLARLPGRRPASPGAAAHTPRLSRPLLSRRYPQKQTAL